MFEIGDFVLNTAWGTHGIIKEHYPYEYDENDLDSDMEDEYTVFCVQSGTTSVLKGYYLQKVN